MLGMMLGMYRPLNLLPKTQSRNLHMVQFTYKSDPDKNIRVGYLDRSCNIVDLNRVDPHLPCTLLDILRCNHLKQVLRMSTLWMPCVPYNDITLKAPIHGMDKILCIGLNYKDHYKIHNLRRPKVPMVISKFPSTIIGPDEAIKIRTNVTKKVDWEVELGVVIGKKADFVPRKKAFKYVMGYTVAQDITARDWQKERNAGQFLLAKSMNTFCPIGPWIVTKNHICDPMNLYLSTIVNGKVRQCGNTSNMIYKIPELIERISSVMTLLPGDLILTGTPACIGMYRNPPQFLKAGDTITSTIENVGVLQNFVENVNSPRRSKRSKKRRKKSRENICKTKSKRRSRKRCGRH